MTAADDAPPSLEWGDGGPVNHADHVGCRDAVTFRRYEA